MQSVNDKLIKIRDALAHLNNVHHYLRPAKGKPPIIVWQEDGSDSDMWGDNRMGEQQLHGTIDLYTETEYDPLVDQIQEALNGIMIGWGLLTVQYEDETNLIHYEWEWRI